MIAHVATFTFRDDVPAAEIDALVDDLRAMAAALPSVRRYLCGPNLGLRPNGAHFGVIALVDDQAGLDAYLDSPEHVELVSRRLVPLLETRHAVQLELPPEWLDAGTEARP